MSENSSGRDFLEQNIERLLPANLPKTPQSELDATREEVYRRTLLRLMRRAKLRWVFNVGLRAAALVAVFVIGVAVGRERAVASGHPAEKGAVLNQQGRPGLIELDPMKRRFQIAEAMARRGEFNEAALEYVAMAVKYPERPEAVQAYRSAGDLFLEADDIERATRAYTEFIKRNRVSPGTPESGELVSRSSWLLTGLASDPNIQRRTEQ